MWGMEGQNFEESIGLVKNAGFDGIEMSLPDNKSSLEKLNSILNDTGCNIVSQVRAEGQTPKEQLLSLEKGMQNAVQFEPLHVNVHCGKDYWPMVENLNVISGCQELAEKYKITVVHEIHRARATFCTTSTMEILDSIPDIRFTADFSHWCCVHNSLLQDQADFVNRIIDRSDYIHARVGSTTTPQITDPRAPEWKFAVEAHILWWQKIVDKHKSSNSEYLAICSEFGPPSYMVTLPYTKQPIANLWEINCYMKDILKSRFG